MGTLQARILGWVAMPFPRESSQPRYWTQVSRMLANSLPSELPGKSKYPIIRSINIFIGCSHNLWPELNVTLFSKLVNFVILFCYIFFSSSPLYMFLYVQGRKFFLNPFSVKLTEEKHTNLFSISFTWPWSLHGEIKLSLEIVATKKKKKKKK